VSPLRRVIVSYLRIQKYTLGHAHLTCDVAYGKRIFVLRSLGFGDAEAKVRFHVCHISKDPLKELGDFLEKAEDSIGLSAIRAVSRDELLEWALPLVMAKRSDHAN
jgi:hypothetical protein